MSVTLTDGVYIENVSKVDAHKLIYELAAGSLPVYLVFFALAGASLKLDLLYAVLLPAGMTKVFDAAHYSDHDETPGDHAGQRPSDLCPEQRAQKPLCRRGQSFDNTRMSCRLTPVEYEDAGAELTQIYDDIKQQLGMPFVPMWFRSQGSVPRLLAGNWEKLRTTLLHGAVPRLLKELILYSVASRQNCDYCTFTHGWMAEQAVRMLGLDDVFRVADYLDSSHIPTSYKTAILVVTRCALDPLATTDDDFSALRDEGFSAVEIQELMAQADLAILLITVAEIYGLEVDRELIQAIHNAPHPSI